MPITLAEIESSLAPWSDPARTVSFMKGRVALHAILRALEVRPGDEVLVPGFTCVVVPAAILYTGATPVFYDVGKGDFNGDPESLVAAISPRTRAVIVQHTFGYPRSMDRALDACRERKIPVVEDCAHALGCVVGGRPVGTLGDAAFCSFQWSKPVTTGLGGLARVNDPILLANVRRLWSAEYEEPSLFKSAQLEALHWAYRTLPIHRIYWFALKSYRALSRAGVVPGSSSTLELGDSRLPPGYRQRFGRLRAGRLRAAMRQLPGSITHRRQIAGIYERGLATVRFESMLPHAGTTAVPLRYPVLVRDREQVLGLAETHGIELGDWFNQPLHPAPCDPAVFGYASGSCPRAERLAAHIINLPTHQGVRHSDAERILAFLLTSGELLTP